MDALKLSLHFSKITEYKKIAGKLHKSIRRRSHYLNSQLACLSLADTDMSVTGRFKFLCTLLSFELPNNKDFYKIKPELPDSAILHTAINLKNLGQSYLLF